jgi:luciferase-like monooxygenase
MRLLDELERHVSSWCEVSAHPHGFGGREFRFRAAEIGHVHTGDIVDIPFPRAIRDALLDEGLAEEHRWVPHSGWITYRVRGEDDLQHALWLMRMSYLRYVLKAAADPRALLERESEQLHLSPRLKALVAAFLPRSAKRASAEAVPA